MKTRRAVFLDRDGVLNGTLVYEDGKTHPPTCPEELAILPGVPEACLKLSSAAYLLIVVTNQPDVARGTQRQEVVEAINDSLRQRITVLDEILVCYHDNVDACFCRKPKPGLLLKAAADWGIDLDASFMVGDRWTDIEAGYAAGCKTVLIRCEPIEAEHRKPDFQAASLAEAVAWILQQASQSRQKGQHMLPSM